MSHDVESMFSVREVPWHGLGTILDAPPANTAEALKLAGLDWKVRRCQLHTHFSDDQANVTESLATDWNAIVRESDRSVLGVVGPNYHPIQNEDAFKFFDPAVEAGLITIETAGSLKAGKRVWMLAKVVGAAAEIVTGDLVNGYFLISNSHDGSLAARLGYTAVRVVCSNTLADAHARGDASLVRVLHTKNAVVELERLREAVDIARHGFQESVERMRLLAKSDVDDAMFRNYVKVVFDVGDLEVESERERLDRLMGKLQPLFECGRGNDREGVKGTAWAAYNAVSEWLTWERGRSADTRLDSLWFGESAQINRRAFDAALGLGK